MVRALRILPDPGEPIEKIEIERLEDYQAVVGGWIEPVDIPNLGVTIFVNEEGLLRHLPFNSRATFLWWYLEPAARQQAMLVGPALVVGLPDRSGDATDVPDTAIELLTRLGEYAVLVKIGDGPAWVTEPLGKFGSTVMPMAAGEPNWFLSAARYEDYFTAAAWAMVLLERWDEAIDTRVVPVAHLPIHLQHVHRPVTETD